MTAPEEGRLAVLEALPPLSVVGAQQSHDPVAVTHGSGQAVAPARLRQQAAPDAAEPDPAAFTALLGEAAEAAAG